ncbi:hypothetical protein PAHAL_5G288400 [Panicum hallii]|uniref:Uncharacterized protein n=1 Tax=Panicum hallii TaxID=206008 RepID=A0A2S3HV44_9POAL|nr:hypothetical protein PAHAL_5G288400 [Panicum hallii]
MNPLETHDAGSPTPLPHPMTLNQAMIWATANPSSAGHSHDLVLLHRVGLVHCRSRPVGAIGYPLNLWQKPGGAIGEDAAACVCQDPCTDEDPQRWRISHQLGR